MKGAFLFAAGLAGAMWLSAGRAYAVVEYCPAEVSVAPLGVEAESLDAYAPSQGYYFTLEGETPRSVSGHVTLHTANGWYGVAFSGVALQKTEDKWQASWGTFSRTAYRSGTMFIRFPSNVSLLSAFVSAAQTTGETTIGWDAKGSVTCADTDDRAMPIISVGAPRGPQLPKKLLSAPAAPTSIPPGATVLVPTITKAPSDVICSTPFSQAMVTQAVSPVNPGMIAISTVVLVEVAISASGALDGAWLYTPARFTQFDDAALRAARASHYSPARAFCEPVPSRYLFRVVFTPD